MAKFDLNRILLSDSHPLIMGILNVTPDSFYDGGKFLDKNQAIDRAMKMAENGADIIDIGGESSRPGAKPVSEKDELARVLPVIKAITSEISIPISIDTYKANIARRALDAGAVIVNDISALRFDGDMAETVKNYDSYVILMHMYGNPRTMQKNPRYENVVDEIFSFLKSRIEFAIERGISKNRIIIDPGIGFGKTLEHNIEILRNIGRFNELGCPVLIGVSRKSMIGMITGAPVEERIWGTAAITAHCVMKGVAIHRVHDVKAMSQVCKVAAAIRG